MIPQNGRWKRFADFVRRRRVHLTLFIPVGLVLFGTAGYWLIEDAYDPFDALYMTVITLSTIGYGETHPLSPAGRAFTIVLILGGVFTLFYSATAVIRGIVSGEFQEHLGRQRMERSLAAMRDHMIVCGFGRMGRLVCQEFSRRGQPFVVIDVEPGVFEGFDIPHGIPVPGDAASDDLLKKAGIERARALVTVMRSDPDNLYTTMSARLLNKKLFIVARVEDPKSEQKLRRAGADRVVSPYQIGGARLALAVLQPTVVDFIELATRTEHLQLQLEETRVDPGSPIAGARLRDSRIRRDFKVIIVAIKKAGGDMVFNPDPETLIEGGDTLVAIGDRENLDSLDRLARKPAG